MIEKHREYDLIVKKILDPTEKRTAKLCVNPYLYTKEFEKKFSEISKSYSNLLEFVFQQYAKSSKIQEVLEYPEELETFLNSLNVYEKNLAAARIDIFVTENDGLKMCESNCEIPGANEESYFLEQEFLKIYGKENLKAMPRMEIVYNTLMKYYEIQADYFGLEKKSSLNVYLTQWRPEIERIMGEYDIIMDYFRKKGHKCGIIDPNEVEIRDNKAYAPDGNRIDLIYRRFTADELPKFANKKWQMAIDWDKAEVAIVNPFCTKRVDSKNIMVLFKDESYEDVFPENLKKDLNLIRSIIPWTKKIKEKIINPYGKEVFAKEYLIKEKDNFVIKHANAYSSSAVFIGSDCSPEKWKEIVEKSLEGDWVAQALIDLPEIEIEYFEDDKIKKEKCIFNVNPYLYDGKFGGFLNRASTDKLTSFKSGVVAAIMPCFEKIK